MIIKRLFLVILLCCGATLSFPQSGDFQSFRNISIDSRATSVNCFAQDSLGMLWIGSHHGLYSFDGYTLQPHTLSQSRYQTFIYSIAVLDATYLALGTEHGVWLYNYRLDRYEAFPEGGPQNVRSLLLDGNDLWIGSLNGLFRYDLENKTVLDYGKEIKGQFTNQTIYALLKHGHNIYIGTYDGLFALDVQSGMSQAMGLPDYKTNTNVFVNSLLASKDGRSIYVGTEYGLYRYESASKHIFKAPVLSRHPVKSMLQHGDDVLLVGTDDGLFVYDTGNQKAERIKHDSRNPNSLANNIIWGMFADRQNNVWVGTDLGVSLWKHQQYEKRFPIYNFTRSSDGNRFYVIFKDNQGWYWLGGDNGLIKTRNLEGHDNESYWYRMDDPVWTIPHNRIRDIFQDRSGLIWIASDGGLNLFDPVSKRFVSFDIRDRSGKRNAKWAYHILEDDQERLWLATYLGGIFVIDKKQLLASKDRKYVSEKSYGVSEGLSEDFTNQIVKDRAGNIWALFYNKGLSKILPDGQVSIVKDEAGNPISQTTFMMVDRSGNIWVGQRGKVVCIAPSGSMKTVQFGDHDTDEVLSMVEVDESIWLASGESIWRINKSTLQIDLLKYGLDISAMYHDSVAKQVYLGSVDEVFTMVNNPKSSAYPANRPIMLTAMYVNNERYGTHDFGLRYRQTITLSHEQNNLRLEFSDLTYGEEEGNRFAYRFKGENDRWISLDQGNNNVQLANLPSGQYNLQVTKLNVQGEAVSDIFELNLDIQYPWYANGWARMIYFLLFVALIAWVVNFFRVRNKLKIERLERRKVLELSQMKMDFFTAMSHELKTPLSLILAPVGQMIVKAKNPERKRQLEGIQRNTLKINSLVQEAMELDKADNAILKYVIRSQIELISFVKAVFTGLENASQYKHLRFSFSSSGEEVYIETDASKLESILTNLLTNACKYNRKDGGIVALNIQKTGDGVVLSVEDDGIGIHPDDLPYVFTKFYRVSSASKSTEGAGVGLYLVKSYCEQLGWNVAISSEENVGTKVTLEIPGTAVVESPISDEDGPSEIASQIKSVLIVDDNLEIAQFLKQELSEDYDCIIAQNGREALELCEKSFLPDIVISDAMMPVMDGLEMSRQLRRRVATSTVPIILLTAKNDRQIQRDSLAIGIDAFVTKPFDMQFLKMQISQLIAQKERIAEQIKLHQIVDRPQSEADGASPDEKLLSQITMLIERNLDDSDFSVSRLGDEVHLGTKQLYRKIKQLTGYTPIEYIRSIRMKKAAVLLKQRKFTISEVMYMVGYSNASYFSKCFQAEFHMSPSAYVEKRGDDAG